MSTWHGLFSPLSYVDRDHIQRSIERNEGYLVGICTSRFLNNYIGVERTKYAETLRVRINTLKAVRDEHFPEKP